MTRLRPLLAVVAVAAFGACARSAESPTPAEARVAMAARLERATSAKVKVTEMRELSLTGCTPAPSLPGVVCEVQMDVVFTVDGAPNRSNDRDRMRFVREDSVWTAYPVK